MKSKHRYILVNGVVTKATAFSVEPCYVYAKTKTEATLLLLKQLEQIKNSPGPILFYKTGAYAFCYPNGKDWTFETGTFDRLDSTGATCGMCVGSRASPKEVREDSTFAYYASEEYQRLANEAKSAAISK